MRCKWFEVLSVHLYVCGVSTRVLYARFQDSFVMSVREAYAYVSFFINATPANKGIEPRTSDVAAQGRNQLLCPSATFDLKSIRFLMLWWNISKSHEQRTQSRGSRV